MDGAPTCCGFVSVPLTDYAVSLPQDEARSQLATLSHQLADLEVQRDAAGAHVQQLQKQLAECNEGMGCVWLCVCVCRQYVELPG